VCPELHTCQIQLVAAHYRISLSRKAIIAAVTSANWS
jgi:hypothetical protein